MKPVIITLALMATSCQPAAAQSVCASHDQIVADLLSIYGETQQSLGLTASGTVIEVFASKAGTWTIIITDANGQTCLAAAGEAWQSMAGDPA